MRLQKRSGLTVLLANGKSQNDVASTRQIRRIKSRLARKRKASEGNDVSMMGDSGVQFHQPSGQMGEYMSLHQPSGQVRVAASGHSDDMSSPKRWIATLDPLDLEGTMAHD